MSAATEPHATVVQRDRDNAMMPRSRHVSFRDPAGKVAVRDDDVVRWVRADACGELDRFLETDLHADLLRSGHVVQSDVLEGPARADAIAALGLEASAVEDADRVLRHSKVPFPSFPYEWAPEMLQAAGRFTLDLARDLRSGDLGLKDATPYNVLFDGPKPVFIDVLSVEGRDAHDPLWVPYAQFARTFLLPLLAEKTFGMPLSDSLIANRDGLEPERLYRLAGPLRRLSRSFLDLVSMPTWLSGRADRSGDVTYAPRREKDPKKAAFVFGATIRGLSKRLDKVGPVAARRSDWSEYMVERDHYAAAEMKTKDAFVEAALKDAEPEWVLDVGCNTGHFSVLAAQHGSRVVSVDLDPVSIGRLWRHADAEGLDILPLVVNVARPTPATGWDNAECPSFLDRAEGRFDCAFMLALIHHLLVTERIPLDEIVALAARLTRRHAVIEYVGPEDQMFKRLLRGRGHLHDDLDRDAFEAAVEKHFTVVRAEALADSDRALYLLEKR